jgi:hypothetical protein
MDCAKIMDFSARKFMVVMIITTYCLSIVASIVLVVRGKMTIETYLAMQAGFGTLVMYIVKAYYDRERPNETQNSEVKK